MLHQVARAYGALEAAGSATPSRSERTGSGVTSTSRGVILSVTAVAPAGAGDTAPCSNMLVGESLVSATDPGGDTGFAGITATLCCAAPSRTPAAV